MKFYNGGRILVNTDFFQDKFEDVLLTEIWFGRPQISCDAIVLKIDTWSGCLTTSCVYCISKMKAHNLFIVRVFEVFIKDCLFSSEAFQIADLIRVLGYHLARRFENYVFAAML